MFSFIYYFDNFVPLRVAADVAQELEKGEFGEINDQPCSSNGTLGEMRLVDCFTKQNPVGNIS